MGSLRGDGPTGSFTIARPAISGNCAVEKVLDYQLPSGTRLPHKFDILLDYQRSGSSAGAREYVSIEVKHMSAVTDQFKCRAFDMLHMKQAFGPSYTASWFLREPFDDFLGIDLLKADSSTLWQPVLDKVDAILTRP